MSSRALRSGKAVGEQLALLVDVAPTAEPAVADVLVERLKQVAKWGGYHADDRRDADGWLALTGGYLEKALQASVAARDATVYGATEAASEAMDEYRRRLVQVAALALAAVESFDRIVALSSDPTPKDPT